MIDFLSFIGVLILLALAGVGALALCQGRETERVRAERQARQAEQAVALLDEGIAQFSASFVRDRQIFLARQAEARTLPGKQRDLEAAAGLGLQSLDLAESLDSTRGAGRLHDLYLRMKPHVQVPAVREFVERAKEFVGGRID